jgi:HSP20 family molecular chaperone IbpA
MYLVTFLNIQSDVQTSDISIEIEGIGPNRIHLSIVWGKTMSDKRFFTLGANINPQKIDARMHDGVLKVWVHKEEGAMTVQPFRNAKRSLHFRKIRGQ